MECKKTKAEELVESISSNQNNYVSIRLSDYEKFKDVVEENKQLVKRSAESDKQLFTFLRPLIKKGIPEEKIQEIIDGNTVLDVYVEDISNFSYNQSNKKKVALIFEI